MFQSLAAIQMYPEKDKHSEADKNIPPRISSRGNGLRPACHSIGDGYVRGRTSGKNSDEQSLTSQKDFGWALWKTQKTATFSQKAGNYLLDVCWTREETSKATASNVISQISSLRDDTSQKCCLRLTAANRSILQPVICRNKNWFIDEDPSVNMNKEGEADANDLGSEFETDRTRQKIRRP
ncbi:hypothetical protein pdam_00025775 [Pocillopora damicornis]|uniref:Uncharacterized protein n=1 Tax=Pocillopora damicornis TaxID=46731 RepID=A0A3M6TUW6_POCDA|nr:hypothetical protein pdam_00025775 [Pocillopora damicornis]